MSKTPLALAIAGALMATGTSSALASTTMYNTFLTTSTTATDGWTRIADSDGDGVNSGPESAGNKGAYVAWVGTSGSMLPFGYTGSSHLNWAVQLNGAGDTAEISAADSQARYLFSAEIDTGGGAWRDNVTPTGWKHQTDIGLIESDVTQWVSLNLTALGQLQPNTFSKFGITVFDGMDTNTGDYKHHGSWNNPTAGKPYDMDNPFGTQGLTNIGYSDNVDGVNAFSFLAEAGKIYSIYLGGVDFSKWNTGVDNYKLTLSTSLTAPTAVPVPGAVWLFGTAIAGMVGLGRRRPSNG